MVFGINDYKFSIDVPYRAGTVLDHYSNNRVNSFNEENVVIPFGAPLVRGTRYNDALLPSATGQEFVGVAIREIIDESVFDDNGDAGYKAGRYFARMTTGLIVVEIETDIAIGDPVFFRHTDNGGFTARKFRNDADGANADEITTGAKWFKPGLASDGYAILELNLP